jgi:mannose-6-phosphate isomerase class I
MKFQAKPYIILPLFIEQPTWGGSYICNLKNLSSNIAFKNKKFGQSYELYQKSKILFDINDTNNPKYVPDIKNGESDKIISNSGLTYNKDYFFLKDFFENKDNLSNEILLIKLTQAYNNSYQIHIKSNVVDPAWQAKPESWYYFEDGIVSIGIKPNIDINLYKNACINIDIQMRSLSDGVIKKTISLDEAKIQAQKLVSKYNPKQYVNVHYVKKNEIIDLSAGGIHHSWEQDLSKLPNGNILYEVQKDVIDSISTLRSFDQGKIKDDGTIRKINIDDYFKYIDINPEINNINNLIKSKVGNQIFKNQYYSMDELMIVNEYTDITSNKNIHLFVRSGSVIVKTSEGEIILNQGTSGLVPYIVNKYIIKPLKNNTTILKTYITS